MAATFDDPSATFDDAVATFDGSAIPAEGSSHNTFRLRTASGGSALRGGSTLRSTAGIGVTVTVDAMYGGVGTGIDATQSVGQGRLIIPTTHVATGTGFDATIVRGGGVLIQVTGPHVAVGTGLDAAIQKVIQAGAPHTGVGTGLTPRAEEVFRPTTGVGVGTGFDATITAVGPPPPASTAWEVAIYDLNASTPRLHFAPVAEWGFGYVLNAPGAFEATVPLTNAQALEANWKAGQREIKVFRNSTLVWGGYLWSTSVDIVEQKVRVVGEGYYSRLRRRFVMGDLIYENPGLPQEDIAFRLIRHTQNQQGSPTNGAGGAGRPPASPPFGELGITEGSNTYTTVRERDYCAAQHPNIADSIDEFTQMDDGFDFAITPTPVISADKSFRTYSPRKQHTSNVTLSGSNTMTLDYEIDASDVVTRMTTVGSGDCNPPDDDRDADSINNFGLLQDILEVQFSNLADVQAHGKEELRNRNTSRWQATATFAEEKGPAWGSCDVGDTVQVVAHKGFADFSMPMRILEYNVSLQPGIRQAFTTLTLDSVAA